MEFKEIGRSEFEAEIIQSLFQMPKGKYNLVKLKLGKEFYYLVEHPYIPSPHYPNSSSSNDLCFQHFAIVVSDMDEAYKKLINYGIKPISKQPQTIPEWNQAAAGIQAFYFTSPDGFPLEIIYFPPGKGNPIWQTKSSLFLGIDHSAIAVSKTERSLKFYQEFLGMNVVGESLNYGETQENLSGVVGAKVKITTLMFPHSKEMGIEFLEYLNPIKKHEVLKDRNEEQKALANMTTIISVDNFTTVATKLAQSPYLYKEISFILDGKIKKFLVISDPDKHLLLIVEGAFM